MSCFAPGTMILTADGEEPVEWLERGVRVVTRDRGLQPVAEVLRVRRSPDWFAQHPDQYPVKIEKGGLDGAYPVDDLTLSNPHRLLLHDAMSELYFGFNEVLVPFRAWMGSDFVSQVLPDHDVTMTYLVFAHHELVQAEGVWTESFFPDAETMAQLAEEDRAAVERAMGPGYDRIHTARRVLTVTESRLVVRPMERDGVQEALIA